MPLLDIITKGATDVGLTLRMADSGDGTPETGVTSATGGLDVWYRRQGAAKTSLTESDLSALTDAHSDGGLLHISDGEYRVDFPDAAFATGVDWVDVGWGATGMVGFGGRIRLTSATRGLSGTALPDAAADAAGGLPISDAGGLDLDAKIGALTYTVAGDVDVNVQSWGGTAISTPPAVNATQISGDGTAADTLELFAEALDQATGQLDSGSLAAGTITAAAVATDAIDADALAADAIAEINATVDTALADYDGPTRAELTSDINSVIAYLEGLVIAKGTIGATGNDTTHVHLDGLTYGNDEINNYLIAIKDVSAGEWHARYVEDWVDAGDLATVATLPFTPEASVDLYALLAFRQDVTGGSGLDAAGVRAAIGLASANLDTQLADIPTVAEFEARTLVAANYFDPAADSVTVGTNSDKTGYSLTATTGLGNQTANITGNLSGSVGSVTGAVGSVTGNVGGNVAGSVASVTAGVTLANGAHGGSSAVLTLERAIIASTTSNQPGLKVSGNGTGAGIETTGGATAHGLECKGGATSGDGLHAHSQGSGAGAHFEAHGADDTYPGLHCIGDGTGAGIHAQAGPGGVDFDGNIQGNLSGTVGGVAGTITTLDALDTAQDTQHSTTQAAIAAVQADLPQRITKNTALAGFEFLMVDSADHVTGKTGLTVTATRSLDGAAFGACANAVAEVSNGIYKIDLAAGDLNGNTVTLRFAATGADDTFISLATQPT